MAEERRLVTVFFADVVGSTELGESLDPEDIRALLARFYAVAREVITGHGGTLEKFIGDAVMAVFGLPHAHGDDPQRALAAALELRDRMRVDDKLGTPLPVRIGINTGEVVAAREDRAGDFLITGDAVNIAARLQQAAEPWAILCGERTARAARGFHFATPRTIDAKGKTEPVQALPLLGRVPVVALRVPLVGRSTDLMQLELAARRAFAERRPFLVSLIATAGIGKTRLLEEFLDRLPGLHREATIATAQCLPYGQRLTYWPLRAVLFRLVGLTDDAQPAAIRHAIRTWVDALGIPGAQRMVELLAATVGAGEIEVGDQTALFAAWRMAVESAAQHRPLVLVFEDLHWSSDSLLDLVEFIMHPRADAPILMIALARPELLDRRPAWGGGRRNYLALALEPLRDEDVAQLVGHLLDASTPEIVARVVQRAEGNPFYAGEIVRSLMERLPSLRDTVAVGRALATLPDTVQTTVLARLDLLPEVERRLLQLGSVFGRTFVLAGIAALAPDLAIDVERAADRLALKDLLRPQDSEGFAFRHILIREVAYSTLPRAERARLHAAAGRWWEELAGGREDALAELIAYHYREAGTLMRVLRLDEAVAEPIRQKAVQWLSRAAEVAAASAALVEASRHLRAAIELAEPAGLPDLYERLGDVSTGDAAVEAYSAALRLSRETGRSPDQQLRVLAGLLTMYMRFQASVGNRPSIEHIQQLRAQTRAFVAQARDERAIAKFLIAEAFYPFWRGVEATAEDLAEAEASARRGLELAERLDDYQLRSAALDGLGSVAQASGGWEAARDTGRQRLAFQDHLDLTERTDAYGVVVWAATILGDLEETDRLTATYFASLQPGQVSAWALHVAAWRAYALMLKGQWDESLLAAERARTMWEESGRGATGYALHGFLAALDVARARQDLVRADRFVEVLDSIFSGFDPETPFGRMRHYLGPDLEALEQRVIRTFHTFPISRWQLVERALALCADHRRIPTPDILRPIVSAATARNARILAGQARRALGLSLSDPSELGQALNQFEQAGAVPYVARVRCEQALLQKDHASLVAGMQALEALGDLEQLMRIQQIQRR